MKVFYCKSKQKYCFERKDDDETVCRDCTCGGSGEWIDIPDGSEEKNVEESE